MDIKDLKPENIETYDDGTKTIIISGNITPDIAFNLMNCNCCHCPWCESVVCHPDSKTKCWGQGCSFYYNDEMDE